MVPADSRRISRVPRYSGAASQIGRVSRTGLSPSAAALSSAFRYAPFSTSLAVLQPRSAPRRRRFGLLRFRSPLLAQSLLFSFPPGTEMFQFPGFASGLRPDDAPERVGLPHSDIRGSQGICPSPRLFAACHVLLRLREPRHPSCALLSFPCVFAFKIFQTLVFYVGLRNILAAARSLFLRFTRFRLRSALSPFNHFDKTRFQYVNVLFSLVVPGRVELPTSTLSV